MCINIVQLRHERLVSFDHVIVVEWSAVKACSKKKERERGKEPFGDSVRLVRFLLRSFLQGREGRKEAPLLYIDASASFTSLSSQHR